MAENMRTCRIHEKYRRIKCDNLPWPGDPDGLCVLHCQDKGKDPEAFSAALIARWNQEGQKYHDFRAVFFPGPFHPVEQKFTKPIVFSWATFTEWANFSWASFTHGIFIRAIFKAEADFTYANYTGTADFTWASFMRGAHFGEATFAEWANFSLANFAEWAVFSKASFKKGADFTRGCFKGGADFSSTTIGGEVIFEKINPAKQEGQALPFDGDFSAIKFQDRGVLRFQDISLAHAKFEGTDLRRPEFHHVAWHRLKGGRQALYDEVLLSRRESSFVKKMFSFTRLVSSPEYPSPLPTEDDYAEVERLYRNLTVNYEKENDYKSSGDFHYGELEMHRRASKWRWFPLYWYNLYRLSSGYGERPLRAVLSLAGLLLLFAAALLFSGGVLEKIGEEWRQAGFWQAFLYVFQQGTLQKPDWLKPASDQGKFLSALMPILIPGQTALFLLALRNRLGRRR